MPTKVAVFFFAMVSSFGSLVGSLAPAHAGMAAAEALIAQHRKMPVFTAPGAAFDAKKCMAGKSMFVIPAASSNPFHVQIANSMASAAKDVGFKLTVWENQSKMDQWVQGVSNAVIQGYNLIDLLAGIPPGVLGPQIKEARDKGIKVTTSHFFDTTQAVPDTIDGSLENNYGEVGEILAAWAIVHTGGKVNALIIGTDEFVATPPLVQGIENYLDKNAPGSKYQYVNAPLPEWGTKIQPSVQSALIANPAINYVLPIYDNMATFVVPALRITNKQSSVKIATYNGSPGILDLLRQGNIEMDIGESLGWFGMAAVDANMRILCGLPRVTESNTPLLIFDKDNVATAGIPADYNKGYGDVHVNAFLKLWGLK